MWCVNARLHTNITATSYTRTMLSKVTCHPPTTRDLVQSKHISLHVRPQLNSPNTTKQTKWRRYLIATDYLKQVSKSILMPQQPAGSKKNKRGLVPLLPHHEAPQKRRKFVKHIDRMVKNDVRVKEWGIGEGRLLMDGRGVKNQTTLLVKRHVSCTKQLQT